MPYERAKKIKKPFLKELHLKNRVRELDDEIYSLTRRLGEIFVATGIASAISFSSDDNIVKITGALLIPSLVVGLSIPKIRKQIINYKDREIAKRTLNIIKVVPEEKVTTFKRLSSEDYQSMSMSSKKDYNIDLREYEYDNGMLLNGLNRRKSNHRDLIKRLKAKRIIRGQSLKIVSDKTEDNKPKIYVCHMRDWDEDAINICLEAINTPSYILLPLDTDFSINRNANLVALNGTVRYYADSGKDGQTAKRMSLDLLREGINILNFANLNVDFIYNNPGEYVANAYALAIASGADVVPVVIDKRDNTYYVSFGKAFNVHREGVRSSLEFVLILKALYKSLFEKMYDKKKDESILSLVRRNDCNEKR